MIFGTFIYNMKQTKIFKILNIKWKDKISNESISTQTKQRLLEEDGYAIILRKPGSKISLGR